MQVVTVGHASNGRYRPGGSGKSCGRTCRACLRVLREGQRVLRVNDYNFVHLPCLRELIDDEPDFYSESMVRREFAAIRQRLIEQHGRTHA